MKHILVLTDFSASAARAADCALAIAAKLGCNLLLINVYPFTPFLPPVTVLPLPLSDPRAARNESTMRLNREVRRLEKRLRHRDSTGGRPVIRPMPLEGSLADCVSQLVRRKKSVLIVMGGSGIYYDDLLFDGDIKVVLRLAILPVLIVPATWTGTKVRHILLATDLASVDQQVIGEIVHLAERLKAEVSVSHVFKPVLIADFAEEKRATAFIESINSLYPDIRYYPARGRNILAALEKICAENRVDVIAMRYQQHLFFYKLLHENPVKDAIEQGRMPLLLYPSNPPGHD